MIALIKVCGVTSKAGERVLIPAGAVALPNPMVISKAGRSSMGILLPESRERSKVEDGART